MRKLTSRIAVFLLCAAAVAASGCSSMLSRVSPWERETLARPGMAWESDRMLGSIRSHAFYSKEASRGGAGGAGGGCGCN